MIKATIYFFTNLEEVLRDIMIQIQKTGKKSSARKDYMLKAGDKTPKEAHRTKKWIVFTSKIGKCRVIIEDKLRIIECNPEDIKIIEIEAEKKFYLWAITEISYTVICEVL